MSLSWSLLMFVTLLMAKMLYVNIGALVFMDLISREDDSDITLVRLILSLATIKSESGSLSHLRQSFSSIYHKTAFSLVCYFHLFSGTN